MKRGPQQEAVFKGHLTSKPQGKAALVPTGVLAPSPLGIRERFCESRLGPVDQ